MGPGFIVGMFPGGITPPRNVRVPPEIFKIWDVEISGNMPKSHLIFSLLFNNNENKLCVDNSMFQPLEMCFIIKRYTNIRILLPSRR